MRHGNAEGQKEEWADGLPALRYRAAAVRLRSCDGIFSQLLLRTEQGEPELRWIVLSEEPGKVYGHGAWRYDSDVTGGLSLS